MKKPSSNQKSRFLSCMLSLLLFIPTLKGQSTTKTDLIIIGGGRSYADAQKAKQGYQAMPELDAQFAGPLSIIKSDSIEGLKPGFYIAILGYCQDPQKAESILKVCRQYLPGVYKRRVSHPVSKAIRFRPQKAPFAGEMRYLLLEFFPEVQNGPTPDTRFRLSGYLTNTEVLVQTQDPVRQHQLGELTVNVYRAWHPKRHTYFYLSEYQFSRIFPLESLRTENCTEEKYNHDVGGFEYPHEERLCKYGDREIFYETDIESVFRSVTYYVYSFREVLMYHIGRGDFDLVNAIEPSDVPGPDCIPKLSKNKLEYECDFEFSGIKIKEGKVVYYDGAGV
ncbi:MAG: hypothetical protein AAFQ87_00480 [Bacteroidota bacterium]